MIKPFLVNLSEIKIILVNVYYIVGFHIMALIQVFFWIC